MLEDNNFQVMPHIFNGDFSMGFDSDLSKPKPSFYKLFFSSVLWVIVLLECISDLNLDVRLTRTDSVQIICSNLAPSTMSVMAKRLPDPPAEKYPQVMMLPPLHLTIGMVYLGVGLCLVCTKSNALASDQLDEI